MEPLKFIFELIDKMSGPSRAITKELKSVDDAIRKTDASLKKAAIDKMTPGLQKQRAELGLQRDALLASATEAEKFADKISSARETIGTVAKVGLAAAVAVAGIGYEMAKSAVEVASFAEDNKVALEVVTGSQEAANRVLKNMIDLASHLPITDQLAMGAATRFMLAGFKEADLANMVSAMSDVQAMNPGRGLDAMNDFANIMTRVKTAGTQVPHLLQAMLGELHLDPKYLLSALQGMGYLLKTTEQLRTALAGGAINKDDFIQATVRALSDMTGGKGSGNISKKLSTTLTGLLSTLEGRKFALMIDLDTSPGYASLRGFLANLVAATDPSSALGKEISSNIATAFNDVFGTVFADFSGPNGARKLADVVRADIIPAFKDLATVVGGIASLTMTIVSGWAQIMRLFHNDGSTPKGDEISPARKWAAGATAQIPGVGPLISAKLLQPQINDNAWSALDKSAQDRVKRVAVQNNIGMLQNGMDFVGGLTKGMQAGTPDVAAAATNLGQAAIDASKAVTETHSPSRVFERLGAFTAEGYALGVRGGAAMAQDSVAAMVTPPRATRFSPGGGGRLPPSIPIQISVDARGATEDTARAIAREVADAVPGAIVRVFDMLATEYGQG